MKMNTSYGGNENRVDNHFFEEDQCVHYTRTIFSSNTWT